MKNILQRTLSAFVCLVMLLSSLPAFSEITPSATLEIIEEAFTPAPTQAPQITAEPSADSETPAPETAAPETDAAQAEASSQPEASPEPEPSSVPEDALPPEDAPAPETEGDTQILTMEQALSALTGEEDQAPSADASGFTYTIQNGQAIIISYSGSEEILIIPDTLEDMPVSGIADQAFSGCDFLAEVHLPESLNAIGSYAFMNCSALRQVILAEGITAISIGESAFEGCAALESLVLPYLCEIGEKAFEGCAALTLEIYAGSSADAYCAQNALACAYREAIQPTAIIPEKSSITIGLNEKVSLAGYILEPAGAQASVTYSSKKSSYASVNADGVVTGKRAGKNTTITLKTDNGEKCSVKVMIKKAPSSIKLSAERSVIGVGEQLKLKASLSSGAASYAIQYASSDESIAIVDEKGMLTALRPGTVQITASTYNGKATKTPLSIEILPAPEEITLSAGEIILGKGDTHTLSYSLNENSASTITYASSDESVATVTAEGKIKAISAEGTAIITAATHNGVSAQCSVTAVAAPESVSVSAERKTIGVGEKIQLTTSVSPEGAAGTVKFKSSKTSVASVSADGVVTAKKAGSATITVTTHNDKKKTIKFTVKKAPSSIKLSAERSVIGVGESLQLKSTLTKNTAAAISYASLDESIAIVDGKGMLTALHPGTAQITASTHNGKATKTPLSIEILPAPEEITLSAGEIILGKGDSHTLSYTLNENSASTITYASSDESVATVTAEGKIKAISAEGTAIITAATHNGVSAQCSVTAVAAPESVSVSAERKTIGVGEKIQLTTSVSPEGAAGTVKFKSSKTSVASISADGVVTAKKAGSATITVTTHNDKKKTIKFTVKKAPSSVTAVSPRSQLGLGDTLQLNYKLSSKSVGTVRFESLTPEIAAVTAEGLVTPISVGTAQFIAITHNGKQSKPCTVEIMETPREILLDSAAFLLGEGMTATLTAQVNPGSAGIISYHTEDAEIAKIDAATGKISALAPGKTRVWAATYVEGLAAYVDVEVLPAPGSVSLPWTKINLGVGDTLQLQPEWEEGTHTSLSYSSKSAKIAKVNAAGVITAVKAGETTITVKTHNGKTCKLTVVVKKAPSSVTAVPASLTLGVGETGALTYKITSGTAATVRMESLNSDIASVDANGIITALNPGMAEIRLTTHNGKKAVCTVHVAPAPEEITLEAPEMLAVGQQGAMIAALLPQGSAGAIAYSIVSQQPDNAPEGAIPVVSIDENGVITALNPGTATLRASSYVEGVSAERTLVVLPVPTSVAFAQDSYTISVDETLLLMPLVDEGCWTQFTYTPKKEGFFTIDENGLLTPIMRGSTTLTVTTHNGLSATAAITIVDPYYPEDIRLAEATPEYMESGDTYIPVITTVPETALPAIVWSSSDAEIVDVDETTGEITAVSYGQAIITGVSTRNPSLKVSFKVTVLDNQLCLTMPKTRTDTSRISKTLSEIRLVRSSAYKELDHLYAQKVISKSDRDKRKAAIERAFDMHLFPWMTDSKELYWKAANSEDGAKDYKPGMVYYGLPYTQTNRNYNVDRVLDKGFFTSTSKGYYKMQGSKFDSRAYPGNDCSSFVSMAIHGMGTDYSYLNTRTIATNSVYRTLSDWTDLRPGDLLNKSGSHVVMFLYWANEAKTQMVIIEQGGSASADRGVDNLEYSNTIACSIKNVSYYTSRSYKIRRLASLGY